MNRPLRLLLLQDVAPDPNTGAPGSILATLAALRERSDVEVEAVFADGLPQRVRHPKLHNLLEQPWGYFQAARRRLASRPYDLILASQPAGWYLARWLRRHRVPTLLVHASQGFEAHVEWVLSRWRKVFPEWDSRPAWRRLATRLLDPWLGSAWRAVARQADGHLVTNTGCRDFLVERYGVDRGRILVRPLGAPEEYLTEPLPPRTDSAPRLLLVGQAEFFKAPMISAGILSQLASALPWLEVTWVTPPSGRQVLERQFGRETLERITWIPWRTREELRAVYDRHDLLLFPSFLEGFGKVMVEAMARGLVVVATDQGGPRDVIRSGETGWLFPVGDVAAGAAACRRALENRAERHQMGERAREQARQYRWSEGTEEIVRFFHFLLASSERTRLRFREDR